MITVEFIAQNIIQLRDEKVILDATLAGLYGVETRALIQAVKRNIRRFPADFMFQLTSEEFSRLRSQSVMSSSWGGRRTAPYAFTEQGVAMLSSVLNSERAVQVNIEVMRAFVKLRYMLVSREDLRDRLDQLEQKYDAQFRIVFDALRELMALPHKQAKGPIGFKVSQKNRE